MTRRPYRARTYVYVCPVCHQGVPIPTLPMQQACKDAGACPTCVQDDYWLARVQIEAIRAHMAALAKRGQALADGPARDRLREVYRKKQAQLQQAQTRLDALRARQEVTV